MRIAIVTFRGFNEIDSFVALNILNRVRGLKAEIAAPESVIASMNGVSVSAQQPLSFALDSDAVLFGSGRLTRQLVEDESILSQLTLDPRRQLIGSQCSGALFLQRLGLLHGRAVCTDNSTRPFLQAAGVATLQKHFDAHGNIATSGGCLASPYLAAWVICKLVGRKQATEALGYVAPVGAEAQFIEDVLAVVDPDCVLTHAPADLAS